MRIVWRRTLAASAALGLLAVSVMAQGPKQGEDEQGFKQMRLTDKMIQNFISAQKEMEPISSKLEAAGDKPDPALQGQLEQIAKKNGFSSLDELGDVGSNISMVLSGLDPKTGQFTELPELIKKDMEELRRNKEMPQKEKNQALADMQEALKTAAPLQFKENVALVRKYQKQLDEVLGQGPEKQQ
jgi:hypothetical protein